MTTLPLPSFPLPKRPDFCCTPGIVLNTGSIAVSQVDKTFSLRTHILKGIPEHKTRKYTLVVDYDG